MDGDFERVKAWLAGDSASAPRSVNSSDGADWTLLHWTVVGDLTPEHIEFARYLISQGARVNAAAERFDGSTALHFACGFVRGEATAAMVSMLVAAGAAVGARAAPDDEVRPPAGLEGADGVHLPAEVQDIAPTCGGRRDPPDPEGPGFHRQLQRCKARNLLKITREGYIFFETARRAVSKNIYPLGAILTRLREKANTRGSRAHSSDSARCRTARAPAPAS